MFVLTVHTILLLPFIVSTDTLLSYLVHYPSSLNPLSYLVHYRSLPPSIHLATWSTTPPPPPSLNPLSYLIHYPSLPQFPQLPGPLALPQSPQLPRPLPPLPQSPQLPGPLALTQSPQLPSPPSSPAQYELSLMLFTYTPDLYIKSPKQLIIINNHNHHT